MEDNPLTEEDKYVHPIPTIKFSYFLLFRQFQRDEATVVIDSSSFELVKGSTIDYVQEMMRSAFAISNNPQSEKACGCGSSFALKNFEANPAID